MVWRELAESGGAIALISYGITLVQAGLWWEGVIAILLGLGLSWLHHRTEVHKG